MLNGFTFENVFTGDYDAYVFDGGNYATPERSIEVVSVAGKNGDVLFDNGKYKDVTVTYHLCIMHEFQKNFLRFRSDIMSLATAKYRELTDTFHPEILRYAYLKSIGTPSMSTDGDAGVFLVSFVCKPQRFDAFEVETEVTDSGTILNNTPYKAYPLITIPAGTAGSFSIGANTVTVADHTAVDIIYDTEINEAYSPAGANMNSYISLSSGVPVLNVGENGITTTVDISVKPRMYDI